MPLIKRSDAKSLSQPLAPEASVSSERTIAAPVFTVAIDAVKAQPDNLGTQLQVDTRCEKVASDGKLSKDGYWRRRETRDIETGIRIRRSGIYQAALQSAGVNQYASGNTLEDYLKVVRKAAEDGLAFINEEAK